MKPNQTTTLPDGISRHHELDARERAKTRARVTRSPSLRISHGIYATGPRPSWADQMRIALALAGPDAVISHTSAARCHGWAAGLEKGPWVVTRPSGVGYHSHRDELTVVRSDVGVRKPCTWDGMAVTNHAQTLKDVLASLPETDAVRWYERNAGRIPTTAVADLHRMRGRGTTVARKRLLLANPSSESWLETAFRLLLVGAGVEEPASQVTLRDAAGNHVARFDFAWTRFRLAVEVDGKQFHSTDADISYDRSRRNRAGVEGWVVLNITYADIVHHPGKVLAMVRAALIQAAAR